MKLNEAQQSAVEYLNGPLLVLAGPGTGKTQLLSSRVEYILKNTDTNPENILCITYTENGAMNMRERLTSVIGQSARKVNIHTYHAFGSDILAAYKNYAEYFDRNLDSPIDAVVQYNIINSILEDLPARDILKTANVSDICSTINSAKNARLTADDLAQIASVNIAESNKISAEANKIFQNLVPRMKYDLALDQVYIPLAEFLATMDNTPILKSIGHIAKPLALSLAEAIEEANSTSKLGPLSDWKRAHFEQDAEGNQRLKDRISNKKLTSFAIVMKKYDEYLAKNGFFDFADMIEEAISILKTDEGFRLTLAEKYQYILLDEFQDTNPSQFEIIKLLTKTTDNPDVMAVGDDDQAICEFQGASASNLSDFKEYYSAHVINLTDNYRSTSEILDFSHRIADQIPDSFAKKHGVAKILRSIKSLLLGADASSATTPVNSEIHRHEFLTSDSEYYWIASEIDKLISSGVHQKDIAIITPKHKYITPLLPYLKSHKNIHISYEKKSNILEDPKISQLISLARFIYDTSIGKTSSVSLLEILSFPFLNIPPLLAINTIHSARADKRSALDYLAKSDNSELKSLADFLALLTVRSLDTPLELFFDYLTGSAPITLDDGKEFRSPFIEYYTKNTESYSTFELYENLSVLKEKIKTHTKTQKPRLVDFINFLNDYETAHAPLVNTSPYQDSSDAVQILTGHASKGLEFEYVFIIATDDMAWGKGGGNNNMFILPSNLIQIRHTGTTDSERLRLFFVAITRAKKYLTITNSIKDFAGKSPKRLEYLGEYIDQDTKELISPYLPEPSRVVTLHYEDLEEAKKCTDLRASWISSYITLDPDLESLLKKHLEDYTLTATGLTSFIDITYGGPLKFYQSLISQYYPEPASYSMIYGNLIHKTFELVTNKKISDSEASDFFRTEAENQPLEPKELNLLMEKGPLDLAISLAEFGPLLRADNARAEVNLKAEHLSYDGIPITGKIDHIAIDPVAKTIEIYDFKTGAYNTGKWESHPTLLKYAFQLVFYKIMLNNSPTYSKYTVTRGHILFVRPDNNTDQVYDKVLEFSEEMENTVKALIKSVYAHIKSLDFIKDKDLAIEPNHEYKIKDVKDFIELILAKTPKIS